MLRNAFDLLKKTVSSFADDECPRMAAALAYYTVFSLPPLMVILFSVSGWFLPESQGVQQQLMTEVQRLLGERAADLMGTMVEEARLSSDQRWWAIAISLGALLFGATGAFAQLQGALNTAWEVEPDPELAGWKTFLRKRVLSLGMILGIAFLLLVSLVISAAISAFSDVLGGVLPAWLSGPALRAINLTLSLLVVTFLFAALFKVLPDAIIRWRDVLVGAAVTAALFTLGKWGIGLYLGSSDVTSVFGGAGSLALLLLWIYYSGLILFLGAEFTQVWAQRYGSGVQPDEFAVRVERTKTYQRDSA